MCTARVRHAGTRYVTIWAARMHPRTLNTGKNAGGMAASRSGFLRPCAEYWPHHKGGQNSRGRIGRVGSRLVHGTGEMTSNIFTLHREGRCITQIDLETFRFASNYGQITAYAYMV